MGNSSVWWDIYEASQIPQLLTTVSLFIDEYLLIFLTTMVFVFLAILYGGTRGWKYLVSSDGKSTSKENFPVLTLKFPAQKIGVEGGAVSVRGCTINFPSGALEEEEEVKIKLQIDRTKWPEGYYGVTPMLYIEGDKTLRVPATVKLYSWFLTRDTAEAKGIQIEVFHYLEDSNRFEAITSLPSNDKAEFPIKSFNPIFVGVPEQFFHYQVHVVTGYLLNIGGNNFEAAFFLRNSNIEPENYNEDQIQINFNPMILNIGDQMKLRVQCTHPEGFQLLPGEDFDFTVDDDFLKFKKLIKFKMRVTSDREMRSQRIRMQTDIYKNDTVADPERPFEYRYISSDKN